MVEDASQKKSMAVAIVNSQLSRLKISVSEGYFVCVYCDNPEIPTAATEQPAIQTSIQNTLVSSHAHEWKKNNTAQPEDPLETKLTKSKGIGEKGLTKIWISEEENYDQRVEEFSTERKLLSKYTSKKYRTANPFQTQDKTLRIREKEASVERISREHDFEEELLDSSDKQNSQMGPKLDTDQFEESEFAVVWNSDSSEGPDSDDYEVNV